MPRGRKLKTPCKKRTLRKCKSADKSCEVASGKKRTFCRTRRNRKSAH